MVKNSTTETYKESIGRRKTATARVRMTPAKNISITVNGADYREYFKTLILQSYVMQPIKEAGQEVSASFSVKVLGGGQVGQAQAIRHGIARVLSEENQEIRNPLKKLGYLSRDPRRKERKKFGFKKARKSSQWSKR